VRFIALFLLALLLAPIAAASEIGLTWDPSDGATGYDISVSQTSGGTGPPIDTAGATSIVTTVPGNCSVSYFKVRAKNAAGYSTWTDEIHSMARPEVADGIFNQGGLHTLTGDNFSPDTEVRIDGSSVPIVLNSVTCQQITFPAAPFTTLTLTNPGADGDLIIPFGFPLSAPTTFRYE
jgi:hypothetical protein